MWAAASNLAQISSDPGRRQVIHGREFQVLVGGVFPCSVLLRIRGLSEEVVVFDGKTLMFRENSVLQNGTLLSDVSRLKLS